MQMFQIDDTWFMQILMAMVLFFTYDRMWMILYIHIYVQKDELMRTYLDHLYTITSCWSSCCWQMLWSKSYSVVADVYHDLLDVWSLSCKGHIKFHDVIIYCSHLMRSLRVIWRTTLCIGRMMKYFSHYQGHVTAYVGFPTMLGMNDVILSLEIDVCMTPWW